LVTLFWVVKVFLKKELNLYKPRSTDLHLKPRSIMNHDS
jgi:hypothetical protein